MFVLIMALLSCTHGLTHMPSSYRYDTSREKMTASFLHGCEAKTPFTSCQQAKVCFRVNRAEAVQMKPWRTATRTRKGVQCALTLISSRFHNKRERRLPKRRRRL